MERTANPCEQPSQYTWLYPGANLPSPRNLSAASCFSLGNCESISQLLMRRGAVHSTAYFYDYMDASSILGGVIADNSQYLGARYTSRSEISTREGWVMTATSMILSNAYSNTYPAEQDGIAVRANHLQAWKLCLGRRRTNLQSNTPQRQTW